jgi:predicted dinucleotide-binding enzyme
MKLGMVGSGNVGGTLGVRWAQAGHEVVFGSRTPDSARMRDLVAKAGPTGRAGLIADAIASSDVLVLATPWEPTKDVLTGAGNLTGKVLIDATNPLLPGLQGLAVGMTTSAGELVAEWARGARVIKAFNTVGFNIMANPGFDGAKPVLFYCGDDASAKATVAELASEIGFDAQDAGPLAQARVLEPFAMLWISLAVKYGYGREIAFRFLRR